MQVACEESDKQYAWLTWLHSFLWNKSGEETLGQWSVSFLPLKSWAYIVCLLAPQREEKGLFLAYLKFLASFLVLDRSGFIFLFLFFCFVFFCEPVSFILSVRWLRNEWWWWVSHGPSGAFTTHSAEPDISPSIHLCSGHRDVLSWEL